MNTDYKPKYVYAGKYNEIWKNRSISCPNEIDTLLISIFRRLNKDKFNNTLPEPNFIMFAKYCFMQDIIRVFGRIHWSDNGRFGISISIEDYLMRGEDSIEKIVLHEMVHLYCKVHSKNVRDGSIDFCYYSGWFKSELYHEPLNFEDNDKLINIKKTTKRLALRFE